MKCSHSEQLRPGSHLKFLSPPSDLDLTCAEQHYTVTQTCAPHLRLCEELKKLRELGPRPPLSSSSEFPYPFPSFTPKPVIGTQITNMASTRQGLKFSPEIIPSCPEEQPYALQFGDYCCPTSSESSDGSCTGRPISWASLCCDGQHVECAAKSGRSCMDHLSVADRS